MVRGMNLRRLRHFDTLYRLGSYARAADIAVVCTNYPVYLPWVTNESWQD